MELSEPDMDLMSAGNIHTIKLCECGCGRPAPISPKDDAKRGYVKGGPQRFVAGHSGRGKKLSKKHREDICRSRTGREPIYSPFIPNLMVRFNTRDNRWRCNNPFSHRVSNHAAVVYEYFFGKIPQGFHVHHKNGHASKLEDDCPNNLMLLPLRWNFALIPALAEGFEIPERRVTEAYLAVFEKAKSPVTLFRDLCALLVFHCQIEVPNPIIERLAA
jgi:hypothetical protein